MKKASGPRKKIISNIRKKFKQKTLTLSEKDLEAVVHGSVAETEELGLDTVKLSNWVKSVLINSKDTTI